ncbi:uncharacterized protein HD556DRAFT_1313957 [Suillus plorans]|uniref:Uncharacterized protein n=1 Tax=Suillus plorans TaxID=116603 RepID=A0A9P7AB03_9AGAM|nr:uncharacterized protein HD556DRAFT_1313957 [Suillus plorans]KAG1785779.1 hypothetical protein HD556DRAFT_1313957 [Suillus plorans]
MAPLLKHAGPRRYTIPSPLGAGLGEDDLIVLVETVRLYLEYDGHLRAGTASQNPTPFGYNDFALAFNMQLAAEADPSRFTIEGTEGPTISGPSPSIVELVGSDDPAPTPPRTTPRPPEGGRYLTPQCAELMEEALWMNLKSAKKKCEWRERSIAERKVKRSKSEVSGRAMGERTYPPDNQAGTSRPASTTPNLRPSTPLASNNEQGHAMEVEEDTRRTGKGKKTSEERPRKTQK